MENRVRKPPVDLNELKEKEEGFGADQEGRVLKRVVREKPEKRSLSYMRDEREESSERSSKLRLGGREGKRRGGGSPGRGLKGISFINVGLAILVTMGLCTFLFATKGNANTLLGNQRVLETRVNGISAVGTNNSERIDNIIENYATKSSLSGYATTGSLSGYATTSSLGSYATKSELNTAVANLTTDSFWLAGTSGNYTFHVDSRPGKYMARISLIYPTPYSLNVTTLEEAYGSFSGNWTGQEFVPEFNGLLEVVSASYYTGSFNITLVEYTGIVGNFTAPGTYTISMDLLSSL
jgi:hypothetical protein